MPLVLVAGCTIECSHKGRAFIPSGDDRLNVSGNGAVTKGMEVGISFAAGSPPCPFTDPKSGKPTPCAATQAAISGVSTVVSVGGTAVLLATAAGLATNDADPAASWKVADAGQQLLSVNG